MMTIVEAVARARASLNHSRDTHAYFAGICGKGMTAEFMNQSNADVEAEAVLAQLQVGLALAIPHENEGHIVVRIVHPLKPST